MAQDRQEQVKFPKRFLWGAATAAHQVEGGLHNNWTVWELENAKRLSIQAKYQYGDLENWSNISDAAESPENYISGDGVKHQKYYLEDFKLIKELNLNSLRFGIEWSRIEPTEGQWSKSALDYYRRYLKSLKEMKITPVVTLFHFTLPQWFSEKGGFAKRRNIKYFVRFCEKVFKELGRDFSYVITVNEPTVFVAESYFQGNWPPNQKSYLRGAWTLINLISAHRKIYKFSRQYRHLRLSMAHHIVDFSPVNQRVVTKLGFKVIDYFTNQLTIRRTRRFSDFIGLNYYLSYQVDGWRFIENADRVNDLGWPMRPARLEKVLIDIYEKFNLPILITENGLADAADQHRKWWLRETIYAMSRAVQARVKLIGYLHWSLLDNFEWDKGYWPRFGLVAVDRESYRRKIRPSAKWFSQFLQSLNR